MDRKVWKVIYSDNSGVTSESFTYCKAECAKGELDKNGWEEIRISPEGDVFLHNSWGLAVMFYIFEPEETLEDCVCEACESSLL
jgi:hypothetical protein